VDSSAPCWIIFMVRIFLRRWCGTLAETVPENVCRLPLKPNASHIGKDCLGDLSLAPDFIVGSGDITEQERA
jgi:hypothetical protein